MALSAGELSAEGLAAAMGAFRDALRRHQAAINRLNVYPVPDGDTGTNLLLTMEAVCAAIEAAGPQAPMADVRAAVAHGSLMGARGNSGVILCQILRAFVEATAAGDPLDAGAFAAGLAASADAARTAVSRPVEGTILTVVARAAAAACAAVEGGADLQAVVASSGAAADAAVAATPGLLEVLAEAGVVDAGGAGFALFFPAVLSALDGRPLPDALVLPEEVAALLEGHELAPVVLRGPDPEGEGPRFEVMFLLDAHDDGIEALRARFDAIGDSTVIVGADPLFNCHVHTDDIGAAIEAGIEAGRPHDIRVTDLHDQVEEERWVREAGAPAEDLRSPPPRTAVVAVATGAGIRRIFGSLGVSRIVPGGQSMNPSTADILDMVESAPGEEIVVLPNNKNIVPVAEQVRALSSKRVTVVPTPGVQEGLAALLAYDPGASAEDNARSMASSCARVVAGEVTRAVRAAVSGAGPVAEGDWIGLSRTGIEVVEPTFVQAACGLIDRLVAPGHEIVTLIEGNGASDAEFAEVETWLEKVHPELVAERHVGGQPLYPLLVSIE